MRLDRFLKISMLTSMIMKLKTTKGAMLLVVSLHPYTGELVFICFGPTSKYFAGTLAMGGQADRMLTERLDLIEDSPCSQRCYAQ